MSAERRPHDWGPLTDEAGNSLPPGMYLVDADGSVVSIVPQEPYEDIYTESPEILDLVGALIDFQGAVAVLPEESKSAYMGHSYTDLGTLLKIVRPGLAAVGVLLTQPCTSSPIRVEADGTESCDVTCRTMLKHRTGQWMRNTMTMTCRPLARRRDRDDDGGAPGGKVTPQAVGSTESYVRRYAILGLLALGSEDDDGGTGSGQQQQNRQGAGSNADRTTGEVGERGNCPDHKVPFQHKSGTRQDGSTYDFWSCPTVIGQKPDGKPDYCKQKPTPPSPVYDRLKHQLPRLFGKGDAADRTALEHFLMDRFSVPTLRLVPPELHDALLVEWKGYDDGQLIGFRIVVTETEEETGEGAGDHNGAIPFPNAAEADARAEAARAETGIPESTGDDPSDYDT